MFKNKKKEVKVKTKGFRDGVTKEGILDLTQDEITKIKLMREINEKMIKNDDAYKCAVRCDAYYQQLDVCVGQIEGTLYKILRSQKVIEQNLVDLKLKKTEQINPHNGKLYTLSDLDLEIIINRRIVNDGLREIWQLMAELYRFVDHTRLDGEVMINKEQYAMKVDWIKKTLKDKGIEVYKERF